MLHKSANELAAGNGDILQIPGSVVAGRKGHIGLGHGLDASICDGNAMSIPAKVIDGIAKTVESLLDVGAPLGFVKVVPEGIPGNRGGKLLA